MLAILPCISSYASVFSIDSVHNSLAKEEREVKEEREEKPQPARRPLNLEVPRPVFNSPSVVFIVS